MPVCLNVTESETGLKFLLRSKFTDARKPFLAIRYNLDLHFCTILCWQGILFIDRNFVRGKCGFWEKAPKLPWRHQFVSEEPLVLEMARRTPWAFLRKRWTYQIQDRSLHFKKLTFLGLHGLGLCGVKTKSAVQIMAKNHFDIIMCHWHTFQ